MTTLSIDRIIDISLVGLGLVIALFAIIQSSLDELVTRRGNVLEKAISFRDDLYTRLGKNQKDEKVADDYDDARNKVNILAKLPYHFNFGYIISGLFFTICITPSYLYLYLQSSNSIIITLTNLSPLFLLFGLINFIYVWFRTIIDLRNLTLEKFDKLQEKEENKDKDRLLKDKNLRKEGN